MDTSEKALLVAHLVSQRRHVLGILEGLSDEQLRRPVMPSGWHCLGMLKHLALSDEHYWFRCVVGGESLDFFPEGPRADWQVEPGEDPSALYREEIERSDAIIAATDLDAPPKFRDPIWDKWGVDFPDVRSVMLWMITETAVHAGHLDSTRELIDGRQWIVL
jgi:hypothetical protein